MFASLFWNRRERRVRSFWRMLLTLLLCAAMHLAIVPVALLVGGYPTLQYSVPSFLSLLAVLASVALAARFLDRRPLADFGLALSGGWLRDALFGFVLGAQAMIGVFLVAWSAGWIEILGAGPASEPAWAFWPGFFALAVLFFCVGVYEEVGFRGYLLRNLGEGLNYPSVGPRGALAVATLLTASAFGAVHAMNPNWTALSVANTVLSGVFFGVTYLLSGQLAVPIGFHISWNLFQNAVFGFPVSGVMLEPSLVRIRQTGPTLGTGGDYGPEGGLLATAALLLSLAVAALWLRLRQGRLVVHCNLAEPPPDRIPTAELVDEGLPPSTHTAGERPV